MVLACLSGALEASMLFLLILAGCEPSAKSQDSQPPELRCNYFLNQAGEVSDISSQLNGTAEQPASIHLQEAGELVLCEGTWYLTLDIEANVSVYGADSSASVVLDAAGSGSVVLVLGEDRNVTLSGLTLQHGVGSMLADPEAAGRLFGGGIGCLSPAQRSTLTLSDVIISDNSAEYGGGLSAYGCTVSIADSSISGNEAERGGGAQLEESVVSLEHVNIENNTASIHGGGINLVASTLSTEDTHIDSNSAQSGAGLYIDYSATTNIKSSQFTNNTASLNGGAIYAQNGPHQLTSTTISNNSAQDGGGIYAYGGELTLDQTAVSENNASDEGGGIFADYYSTISCSGSEDILAGIFANTASFGGGMMIYSESTLSAVLCDFGVGSEDNTPEDILTFRSGNRYYLENKASIRCDDEQCF
jgi:predicted outer membrane repeat protein